MIQLIRRYFPVLAILLLILSIWQLEAPRVGLDISHDSVGTTPVTVYAPSGEPGPTIVIAHGFAGSRQIMSTYSLHLAQAGYRVVAFDFEGHGTNPVPMSGDVTSVDGTTRKLVDETKRGIAWSAKDTSQPIGLLGHSMATDILIRAANEAEEAIGPIVALSAFSGAVSATQPPDLLLISGEWEQRLRDFGLDAVQMIDPGAGEGTLVQAPGIRRQAIVAPAVEHVGILYSHTAQREALDWFNAAYARDQVVPPLSIGPWLLVLLGALVALAGQGVRYLPLRPFSHVPMAPRQSATVLLVPALLSPALAIWVDTAFLPVLVADYLLVHLALYGAIGCGLLWYFGLRPGGTTVIAAAFVAVWGIGIFGAALQRYGANFWPEGPRVFILAALVLGTVPFALFDALATAGRRWAVRALARLIFVGSLVLAVMLDFERLFFLALIAPIILLFFVIFGPLGRWVSERSGPAAAGIGLGVILAWALGVTFPLFSV